MIDWTPIFNALIMLCAAVITAIAVPYVRQNLGKSEYETFLLYVKVAVEAADQIFPKDKREEKKAYVYGYLHDLGFDFDELTMDNAIESAVLQVHNALVSKEASDDKEQKDK